MSTRTINEENVLRVAGQYGRVKLLGIYVDQGNITVAADKEHTAKLFQRKLLEAAEELIVNLGCINEKGEIEE
jgi:hypothetical protein